MKVKVCCTQMSMSWNIEKNIEQADALIAEASKEGANIILLPELFMTPYFCQTEDYNHFALAQSLEDSTLIKHYQEIAKKYDVVLPISFFEKSNNCYFTSLVATYADGKVIDLYRKSHTPTGQCYEEKFYFTPGDLGFEPIQTSGGKLGVLVCWDQWYPEAARLMTLKGAELLIYPTAIGWFDGDSKEEKSRQLDAWITIQRSHAIANGVPVLSCNRVGFEKDSAGVMEGIRFWGNSFVCDPQGSVIAQAESENETILYAQIDHARTKEVRDIWPFLRDRRIDAYGNVLKRYCD